MDQRGIYTNASQAGDDYRERNSACSADGGHRTPDEDASDDSDSPGSAAFMDSEFTARTTDKPARGKTNLIIHPPNESDSGKQRQTDTTMPPTNKGTITRKASDVDSDEDGTAQNGSDQDSPPPRKRQRSRENERSAGAIQIMSSPTISELSSIPGREEICPETPQPRSTSIALLEKKRVAPSRMPPVSRNPAPRPTSTQQSGGTMQQSQDSKQQFENLRQQVEILRRRQEETNSVLFQLYREWDPTGRKKLPEMDQRLNLIARTMKKEPGTLGERVFEDVQSLSYSNEKFRKTLKSLVGNQHDRPFPVHPLRRDIDGGWRRLQKGFRDAIVYDYPHDSQLPEEWIAGYLASQTSHLFKDNNASLDPASYIEELEVPLDNMHTVLNLVSTLLCLWMFATPDAFCSELYSHKELKMYETTLVTGKLLPSLPLPPRGNIH
jgi:hypothetical protein